MAERAFTRRAAGANPIALELDRLAEQHALQTLGQSRGSLRGGTKDMPLPRSLDRTATDAPMASEEEIAAELAQTEARRQASPDAAQWAQLSPPVQQLANAWDVAPGELDAAMQRAQQPFQYEPGDPYWGGLEEDEAHDLWADRQNQLLNLARLLANGGR